MRLQIYYILKPALYTNQTGELNMKTASLIAIGLFDLHLDAFVYFFLLLLIFSSLGILFHAEKKLEKLINPKLATRKAIIKISKRVLAWYLFLCCILLVGIYIWSNGSLNKFRARETYSILEIIFFLFSASVIISSRLRVLNAPDVYFEDTLKKLKD